MDQIANMMNMIKNAKAHEHEFVVVPYSKLKNAIAECLVKEGFLKSVSKKTKKNFPVLELGVMYVDGMAKINDVQRVSKSSARVYKGVKEIKTSNSRHGLVVMSTPKGILTDRQARKEMVGGEVLFKVW